MVPFDIAAGKVFGPRTIQHRIKSNGVTQYEIVSDSNFRAKFDVSICPTPEAGGHWHCDWSVVIYAEDTETLLIAIRALDSEISAGCKPAPTTNASNIPDTRPDRMHLLRESPGSRDAG
jgi:hypothetical protein